MKLEESYFTLQQVPLLWNSTIGIEREALRINHQGQLSHQKHPIEWGTRNHQPYIQTDFAESQIEIITPPEYQEEKIMDWLKAAHQIVATTNQSRQEWLWPFSTPGLIPDKTEDIKIAQLTNQKEYNYRTYLADLYGKHVQLISGIHYNFQLNPNAIAESFNNQNEIGQLTDYNNRAYMHLARNYFRYRWFLTYFIGASPFVAPNYSTNFYGKPHKERMRSIRQSHYGYQNKSSVVMDYSNLESFVESIEAAVNRGDLSLEKELYRDVRFRGGSRARDLLSKGITYLEFRNVDINPYQAYGIGKDSIRFIHVFLIALLFMEDKYSDSQVVKGNEMNYHIAESDPLDPCPYMEEALDILAIMKEVCRHLDPGDKECVDFNKLEAALSHPELTLAGQIVQDAPDFESYLQLGLKLAQNHHAQFLQKPYQLHGFEDYELSTQDVMKEAIKIGIKIKEIDPSDNLIALQYQDHIEYVRNANMTSQDSLISYFLMENKVATKHILKDYGITVPKGRHFDQIDSAKAAYASLPDRALVIKPKNTNYGIGISIFSHKPDLEAYIEALEIAFKEDETVLIEDYIEGTELRFYVQNGQTKAIVERQPAQVIGDGQSCVSQLIDQVNADPLRGHAHMAPLTYLEKGHIEQIQLQQQGLNFESIPDKGQVVHLRENSNVSTGGISIDRSHEVDQSYKKIAAQVARALQANFCGVDIIIKDYKVPACKDNYSVLEANFNPNISIHRFPGRGQSHLLGRAVLEQLFPQAYENAQK